MALGFERIRALLEKLENPHEELETVQIVGTNGKGTTAVALAGALEAAGLRSGAYLSPHVLSYTERIMLGAGRVSDRDFAVVMDEVIALADEHEVPATQFELLTAGALKLFRDRGIGWAVLEAGLGARHDATSVVGSELVVLTNVGLDHTEHLGSSVEDIAREKLASLRPETRLILGTEDPRVIEVALGACEEVGAKLVEAVRRPDHLASVAEGLAPYLAHGARVGVRAAETILGRALNEAETRGASTERRPWPAGKRRFGWRPKASPSSAPGSRSRATPWRWRRPPAGCGRWRARGWSGAPRVLPQPRLFALDALGDGGWSKALRLGGYAPRGPRRPEGLQRALFAYHEARG